MEEKAELADIIRSVVGTVPDIKPARERVKEGIEMYTTAAASLSNVIAVQNLKSQKRKDAIEWIWDGKIASEELHSLLLQDLIPNSGTWFLESFQYQEWLAFDEGVTTLICPGIRKSRALRANNSWSWENIHDVRLW
jgi:hypothetical protein